MVQLNAQDKLQRRYYRLQLAASFLNVLISFYLLVSHTRLKFGIQDEASLCSLGKFADCDMVNSSSYSEVFGLPVAALGALFYGFLFLLAILAPPKSKGFPFFQRTVLGLSTLGFTVNFLYFDIVQLFILKSVCLFCATTHVISLIHVFAVVRTQSAGRFLKTFREILKTPQTYKKNSVSPSRWKWGVCGFVVFAALVGFVPRYFKSNAMGYDHLREETDKAIAEFAKARGHKMEVEMHNGTFGNRNAKVQIVAFSDFECPFCRKAAFTLHTALAPFKDRVHFVFKHFPLNATCNPRLQYQMHAHACNLASLAICAQKKGKFWDFHDYVFLKLPEEAFKESWEKVRKDLGNVFTPPEIEACLQNPRIAEAISEDVQAGVTAKIRGTPAIFINGKSLTVPLTIDSLRRLIELEEKASAP